MRKFIVKGDQLEGSMTFEYSGDGILQHFTNESAWTAEQVVYMATHFPTSVDILKELIGLSSTLDAKEVNRDLSFTAIWNAYDHKVGNKKQAEKLWDKLNEAEKVMVFDSLGSYNYYLRIKGIEKAYLTTYLNQRRFETDYKQLIKK